MSKKYEWLKRTDRGWFAKPSVCYAGPNARTVFDREGLDVLKAQVKGVGVQQPLLARRRSNDEGGELQVWDGARRLLVANELIAEGQPIEWVPVSIQRKSDADMMIAAAMTHAGKEPLDPVDEANMIGMLVGYGLKATEISDRLGKSVPWVNRRRQLLLLEPPARDALREGKLTLGRAEQLSKLEGDDQKARLPKGSQEKPQGTPHRRPGKRAAKVLLDRIGDRSWIPSTKLRSSADLVRRMIQWSLGEVSTDDLLADFCFGGDPAPPAAPKVP